MLKKIHFAEPTIKFSEQLKHQSKAEKLRRQIMSGSTRQSMMQAARAMLLPRSSVKIGERRASRGSNELLPTEKRKPRYQKQRKHSLRPVAEERTFDARPEELPDVLHSQLIDGSAEIHERRPHRSGVQGRKNFLKINMTCNLKKPVNPDK